MAAYFIYRFFFLKTLHKQATVGVQKSNSFKYVVLCQIDRYINEKHKPSSTPQPKEKKRTNTAPFCTMPAHTNY